MQNFFSQLMDKAQLVRIDIQNKFGSSGNLISTSDIHRGIREDEADEELDRDMKKFFYKSPRDFFSNHLKNAEEFIDKHISQKIDKFNENLYD